MPRDGRVHGFYRLPVFGSIALLLIVAGLTRFQQTPLRDELNWNLPIIERFVAEYPVVDIDDYGSASGPVPYYLWATAARVVGSGLPAMRAVTFVLALAAVFALARLAGREEWRGRLALLVPLVVLFPYFFPYAFSIYTAIPALTFALWGLVCVRSPRFGVVVLGGVLLSLALASRQTYAAYAAGFLIATVLRRDSERHRAYRLLALALPLVVLAGLAVHWGGFTPPTATKSYVLGHRGFEQIGLFLIFLGFWFVPVTADALMNTRRWMWVVIPVAALFYVLGPHYAQEIGRIEGVLPRLLAVAESRGLPPTLLRIGEGMLCGFGIVVLVRLFTAPRREYAWIVTVHAAALLWIPLLWERYYLPSVPIVWLSLLPQIPASRRLLVLSWLGVQTAILAAYLIYKW